METYNIILGLLVKDWMNSLCPSCQNHQQTLGSYCNATCESLIHSAKDCIPVHLCRHVRWVEWFSWNSKLPFDIRYGLSVGLHLLGKVKKCYKAEATRRTKQQSYMHCQKTHLWCSGLNGPRDCWKRSSYKVKVVATAPVIDGVSWDLRLLDNGQQIKKCCS